jgi:hypothetical protein
MAKIVDVTDVPEFPGAGLLHFDDGRPPLMALPEIADEHRERLGVSAMQGVAGDNAVQPEEPATWDTEFGSFPVQAPTPPPPAAPAPPPVTPPAPPAEQGAPGVPPMLARSPGPEAPPSPEDAAMAASNARIDQALLTGRMPGGPVTPGRPAGFSPDIKKVVNEAGPAYDPRAAGERQDAGDMVLDAQLAKAASEKQTADALVADATAKNLAAQQQVAAQQAEMLRKRQAFQQQDAALQQDLADYSESAKPDPNRYWSTPGGAFSGMLSLIGQGLGAFGATIGHTQNWAFEAAQRKIQLEMAAQEKAYDAGRGDRKNALARLTEHYHGDIDMGKLALQQALNKVAETETNRFAAQARSKDIVANAQVMAAQFQQQQLLSEQQRAELAAGKTTTTVEDKFHQATGGGGGSKPLTIEQELALRKAKKPENPISAKAEKKFQVDYGKAKEDEAPARSALGEYAKTLGATWDQKAGQWVAPKGVAVSGHGITGMAPDFLTTQEGRNFRRVYNDVLSQTIKMRSGAAATEAEVDRLNKVVGGTYDSDLLGGLNHLQKLQDSAARERDAAYGPDIVEHHEGNRRGVVRKAQTDPAYAPEEIDE